MKLILKHKTTLQTPDGVILINDRSGYCYSFKNETGEPHIFNLPRGTYYTKNKVVKCKRVLIYDLAISLPEGYRKLPKKLTYEYAVNKHKCSVYPDKGLIVFDNSFKKIPRFIKQYIVFHELGHYFYFGNKGISEAKCDTFANLCMYIIGYNPTQCYIANQWSLSNAQCDRKNINHLINRKNGFNKRRFK